jgi:hypothetical protein
MPFAKICHSGYCNRDSYDDNGKQESSPHRWACHHDSSPPIRFVKWFCFLWRWPGRLGWWHLNSPCPLPLALKRSIARICN